MRNGKTLLNIRLLLLFIGLISAGASYGQFYNGSRLDFGKNRVQYNKDRVWFFYRFKKFNTYYYRGGKDLAIYTYKYAHKQIRKMEDKLDYPLEEKVHFLTFQSLNDLKESNIGLVSNEQYNVGGITHLVGNKVFLYFNGDHSHLEKQIRRGIANIMIERMIMGTKALSAVKNNTLLSLPDWYKQGLIAYLANPWGTKMDNYVRDGILSGRYEDFNNLKGDDAIYAGHSIWKYIADEYGKRVIPNIVYMTKASRNIESAFLYVLGTSYKSLLKEWRQYYKTMYSYNENKYTSVEDFEPVKNEIKQKKKYYNPRISPNGKWLVYARNHLGKLKVYLKNLKTGNKEKILTQGHKLDQKVDYTYPIVAWHPTSKLFSMLVERERDNFLFYFDMKKRELERKELFKVQKILDIDYNHKGNKIVLSAVKGGQTDIFVYNLASETYEQITDDVFDEWHPRFINQSTDIIFSSNRTSDTLKKERVYFRRDKSWDSVTIPDQSDIFIYHYDTDSKHLWRITNTPNISETQPEEFRKGYVAYLSNKNGIKNRFIAKFDSAISYVDTTVHYRYFSETTPISDYNRSILSHDISLNAGKIVEHVFHNGYDKFFLKDIPNWDSLQDKNLENTFYRNQVISRNQKKKQEKDTVKQEEKQQKTDQKQFVPLMESDTGSDKEKPDSSSVDIENYDFESSTQKTSNDTSSRKKRKKGKQKEPTALNYYVEYSINKLISQVDFSFMNKSYQPFTGGGGPIYLNPGFNGLFMVGATDLMEDYRITGGVRLSTNLQNNEYLLSYENLKNRLDRQWVFHRKSYENQRENTIQRIASHNLYYKLKWPFSQVFSARMTASARYDRATILATDYTTLQIPNEHYTWGGLKGELVFDNTRDRGINTKFGTRWKTFGEYYQLFDDARENVNLFVVGMDFRNYLPIHRSLVWANRLAASSSFGSAKLIYYMGGVDNWLIPKFNRQISIDYDQNYAYQTLATPMRGFKQNIRNGNSFALYNSELRFPAVRYFSKKPLKSEFLRSLQLVGFLDIGSAWVGLNPYSDENTLIEKTYEDKPFKVTVKRTVEPFVGGAGAGLRAKLFGYFIRLDYAWGYVEGNIKKPRLYLSFNLDF